MADKYKRLIWIDNGTAIGAEDTTTGHVSRVVGDLRGYFVGIKAPVEKCKGGVRVSQDRPVGAR